MRRGRPSKPDVQKMKKILLVLKRVKTWIWISQIARIVKMPESTTRYYLNKYFRPFLEEQKPYIEPLRKYVKFRPVRLKNPSVSLKKILEFHKIKSSLEE